MKKVFLYIGSKMEFIAFAGPAIICLVASIIFFICSLYDVINIFYAFFCFLMSILLWIIYKANQKNIKKDYISREHRYWYFTISMGGVFAIFITIAALVSASQLKVFPFLFGEKSTINLKLLLKYLPLYFQALMFLLAIVAFMLAYLNFNRKHGASLSGNFICDFSDQKLPYIKEIKIYNEKDKITSIFSINVILNNKEKIKIIDFEDNPFILKAFTLERIELPPVFKYTNLAKRPDFSLPMTKLECLTEVGIVKINNKEFTMIVDSEALRLPVTIPNVPLDSTHLVMFYDDINPIPVKLQGRQFIITNFCNDYKIRCIEQIKLPQELVFSLDIGEDISFKLKQLYIKQIGILKSGSYSPGIDPEFMKIIQLPLTNSVILPKNNTDDK